MDLAALLKKNFVLVPVGASGLVGTFTGVKYVVNLTDTINENKAQIENIPNPFYKFFNHFSSPQFRKRSYPCLRFSIYECLLHSTLKFAPSNLELDPSQ